MCLKQTTVLTFKHVLEIAIVLTCVSAHRLLCDNVII
jgi:hypothetical protein